MKVELVTSLKRHATEILKDLHNHREPILITEHGKPSAYLVDVKYLESMRERMALLEGLVKGERAISEGRILSNKEAKERLSKWRR